MAISVRWDFLDRLALFSLLYVPGGTYEQCFERDNETVTLRKLRCPVSCCGESDYHKYCCGTVVNTTEVDSIPSPSLSEGQIGTIIGGVVVFIAMAGGVVACCFCKPSCVPDNAVGGSNWQRQHQQHRYPQGGVVMNPAFDNGIVQHPAVGINAMTPVHIDSVQNV